MAYKGTYDPTVRVAIRHACGHTPTRDLSRVLRAERSAHAAELAALPCADCAQGPTCPCCGEPVAEGVLHRGVPR